jgi:hypothetical protein
MCTLRPQGRRGMAQKHVERGFGEMPMLYEQTPQHNFWIASIQRLSIENRVCRY